MGALRVGLPVVPVPVGAADNVSNARRLEMIGAGRAVMHEDRSSRDVAKALRHVLDDASYGAAAGPAWCTVPQFSLDDAGDLLEFACG